MEETLRMSRAHFAGSSPAERRRAPRDRVFSRVKQPSRDKAEA